MGYFENLKPQAIMVGRRAEFHAFNITNLLQGIRQILHDTAEDARLSDNVIRQYFNFSGATSKAFDPVTVPPGEIWTLDVFTSTDASGQLVDAAGNVLLTPASIMGEHGLTVPPGISLLFKSNAACVGYVQFTRQYLIDRAKNASMGRSRELVSTGVGPEHERARDVFDSAASRPSGLSVVE